MFAEVKIKLKEALGVSEVIQSVMAEIKEVEWNIGYRFMRQLKRIGQDIPDLNQIKVDIIKEILPEKKFEKFSKEGGDIKSVLTDKQYEKYDDAFVEELNQEVTVGLLNRDFFKDLPEGVKFSVPTTSKMVDLQDFYEEHVWSSAEKEKEA